MRLPLLADNFNACSICAHDIHDARCRHPWKLPFEKWPKDMLRKLKELVPDQYYPC
jgi:hypothetical protein